MQEWWELVSMTLCHYIDRYMREWEKREVLKNNMEIFLQQFRFEHSKLEKEERARAHTCVGERFVSYYWTIYRIFCRTATQYHTLGAEELRFWFGESYFRRGGQVQESSQLWQSTNKPVINNVRTTEDLFPLFTFFPFFNTCSIPMSLSALSATSL